MWTREDDNLLGEWHARIRNRLFIPLAEVEVAGFVGRDNLSLAEAAGRPFHPIPTGFEWGELHEYGWFRMQVTTPPDAAGRRLVLRPGVGGVEGLVFCNGQPLEGLAWGAHHERLFPTLSRQASPGETFDLMMEVHGGRTQKVAPTCVGVWDEDVYQLRLDVEALMQVRLGLTSSTLAGVEVSEALRRALRMVDFDAEPFLFHDGIVRARQHLAPFLARPADPHSPLFIGFGHGHLDVAWWWPLEETRRKMARTTANQLALMDEYPEHRFLMPQPVLHRMLEQHYPGLAKRVEQAVKAGRIVADGAMWLEADTCLSSGESLIRQIIWGQRYFREKYGVESRFLWLPDVFGYSASLPQIAQGCGVTGFATAKLSWRDRGEAEFPYDTFWWQGIDGTRLLTHLIPKYSNGTGPTALCDSWNKRRRQDDLPVRMHPFGHGDGGGGPNRDHVEMARRTANMEGCHRLRISSPCDFFEAIAPYVDHLPAFVGELYVQMHQGTLTSQSRIKQGNRRCEVALREAEFWSALASATGRAEYAKSDLDAAWDTLLLTHFHDILPGTCIREVVEDAEKRHSEVEATGHRISDSAARTCAGKGDGLSVFNSLSWARKELVALPPGWVGARSGDQLLQTQIMGQGRCLVEVSLPPCGWTVLQSARQVSPPDPSCGADTARLENDILRVTLHARGELVSVRDKTTGEEWLTAPANRLHLYRDDPFKWDAWDLDTHYRELELPVEGDAEITVLASGPLLAQLRIVRIVGGSRLVQDIALRRGSRRLDFETHVEWKERHRLLKVGFPVRVHADEALSEMQFGHIRRPTHSSWPIDAARFEVCNHRWTALVEEGRGCAVLNNGRYGVNVIGNEISLTLLRGPVSPDPQGDVGEHRFTYSFLCWNGSLWNSPLLAESSALNIPPTIVNGGNGQVSRSLLEVNKPNVVVETVKLADDDSGDLVVRLFEAMRTHTECTVQWNLPVAEVWRTDLREQKTHPLTCTDGQTSLSLTPFQIATLRLRVLREEKQ